MVGTIGVEVSMVPLVYQKVSMVSLGYKKYQRYHWYTRGIVIWMSKDKDS